MAKGLDQIVLTDKDVHAKYGKSIIAAADVYFQSDNAQFNIESIKIDGKLVIKQANQVYVAQDVEAERGIIIDGTSNNRAQTLNTLMTGDNVISGGDVSVIGNLYARKDIMVGQRLIVNYGGVVADKIFAGELVACLKDMGSFLMNTDWINIESYQGAYILGGVTTEKLFSKGTLISNVNDLTLGMIKNKMDKDQAKAFVSYMRRFHNPNFVLKGKANTKIKNVR